MTNEANTGDPVATIKIRGRGDHQLRGAVTIGRDPRAGEGGTVVVDGDPLVSKSHLCIDVDQGELIIKDLGSSNGTYLHHPAGEIAVPSDRWVPIPSGAEIEFGDQRMTVEWFVPVDPPDPDITPVSPRRVHSDTAASQDSAPAVEDPGQTVVLPPDGLATASHSPSPQHAQPPMADEAQVPPQPANGPVVVDSAVATSPTRGIARRVAAGVPAGWVVAGVGLLSTSMTRWFHRGPGSRFGGLELADNIRSGVLSPSWGVWVAAGLYFLVALGGGFIATAALGHPAIVIVRGIVAMACFIGVLLLARAIPPTNWSFGPTIATLALGLALAMSVTQLMSRERK